MLYCDTQHHTIVRRTQVGPISVLADSDVWMCNRADTHRGAGTLYKPCVSSLTHFRCPTLSLVSLVEMDKDVCRLRRL